MGKIKKRNDLFNIMESPFILFLIILTLASAVSVNGKMGNDEGIWSYIGRIWIQNGIPPYVGAVENKTPGIFELAAVSYYLFGVNFFFLRLIGILCISFSSLLIYGIGRELHGRPAGIYSMTVFGLMMTWKLLDGDFTAQTETFLVFFSALSFYLLIKGIQHQEWRHRIFLAGCSMGMAIAFKQIALTTATALIVFFLMNASRTFNRKERVLGSALIVCGIFSSTLLSLIPLLASGVSISEYLEGAWLILVNHHPSMPMPTAVPAVSDATASALCAGSCTEPSVNVYVHSRFLYFFQTWCNSRIVMVYPFLALIVFQRHLLKNKYFICLLIWMFFDYLGVNASGKYYGHQIKQIIPSLSLITGILLSNILLMDHGTSTGKNKDLLKTLVLLIVLFFPFQLITENIVKFTKDYTNRDKELGIWLRDHCTINDYVYIIGDKGNSILSYSERLSSSKYINSTFCNKIDDKIMLQLDLKDNPPLFLLRSKETKSISKAIDDHIKSDFSLIHTKYGYEIYKLSQSP